MSSMHHHTWQQHHVPSLMITVELDPIADGHSFDCDRRSDLTKQLLELFDTHRVPATWGVSDPAHSAATSLVLRSTVDHELAILGDPNWLGPTAGRTRFARELARRVAQSRAAGVHVRTLIPRVESVKRHIDLVIKHEIAAVAGIEPPLQSATTWPVPRALHYGVWELPVADRLPRRWLWFFQAGRSVLRKIRQAARDGAAFHLVIDASELEAEGRPAQASVAWLIGRIGNLRDRGVVRVSTLGAVAAQLADLPVASPQRSILRRVA